jgi:predicted RNase H-like HicB family nuclease
MDRLTARKLRYYARLHYPVEVTATDGGFRGLFPDLPGCERGAENPRDLYAVLEHARREWIAERLLGGGHVPLPNSHRLAGELRAPVNRGGRDGASASASATVAC